MHLPCTADVDMPVIGFPSRFPSLCSLPIFFLVGVVLMLALRFALHRKSQKPVALSAEKEKPSQIVEVVQLERKSSWRLFRWDGLPITLSATSPSSLPGKGVGVTVHVTPSSQSTPSELRWQRRGPSFEQPVPAIYQCQEPLSMAKIIMSRHTFRRPGPKQPRRASSVPPTVHHTVAPAPHPTSKPNSMV